MVNIASPIFGFVIDKTGRNLYWMFHYNIETVLTNWNKVMVESFVSMDILGVSYSVWASASRPLVSSIIPEYQVLKTTYGICQSIQNLGLAVVAIISGLIVDAGGFYWLELFVIAPF